MFGDFRQPAVLVLGLGASGLALARWCARYGCRVRIADTRAAPPKLAALKEEQIEAELICGEVTPALLDGIELIALSPGISPSHAEFATLLEAARARGLPLWGELEFFAQALRALTTEAYRPKIIAITGTNGKTTTTALTGLLCERAGRNVSLAGNIGPPLLERLAAALNADLLPEIWVLELSSFQLTSAYTFAPDAAAILNITQDHLDWHPSFEHYAAAKGRIFGAHTVRILNRDDASTMALAQSSGWISEETEKNRCSAKPQTAGVLTFGLDAPHSSGDYGLLHESGMTWLAVAESTAEHGAPRSARARRAELETEIVVKKLMPVEALRIRGFHNAANALAALALCRALELPLASLMHGLREYRGEPHRVEAICALNGVEFIDDSKGTNVGATVAALNGLARQVVLILGGDGKGQDFAPLAAPVARWCRAVMLIGRDAPRLRQALAETGVPLTEYATLIEATQAAASVAQTGEIVLLSPACASFDMFRDYRHRAQVFRQAVAELAGACGVAL
ncbi:UDP-N-acetylmuramoyl-L-alanyl-D-glutamate synthetase [Mycoavidus cysteinexigens]|uniref:UDP-N-acetylmuramoylalanine--D-glutamate ligase n=1 Tax=Mycoavidus cysteinexigens TaxID=1553431 RepID=A0A2Z6EYH8_9BURK|nr:UDP-N-acetylmuramoyl-L-alanine--D-glutamate ligase [Mycoavidus cysteinexigens]BBE10205.1 UDP-N-acetylmuramoyl-L-alanyl-D-glutamate synthetase [Mycoavidus cysteinexigens]GAM53433.1 UDP-N-acetylmuramoylalanine--D-glutamate ligase [bacterium endosymbiont of Mortierella elongata FMR23-6]GLR00622.1 UDP-N-acetylmuramoylalanine--D-glutamate ligase [Mycoavidus cysteinexigens]